MGVSSSMLRDQEDKCPGAGGDDRLAGADRTLAGG
jgi:hypothetical protein